MFEDEREVRLIGFANAAVPGVKLIGLLSGGRFFLILHCQPNPAYRPKVL